MQNESLGKRTSRRYQQLLRRRDSMRNHFGLLSKYVNQRPIYFGDTSQPGRMPNLSVKGVSDDTAVDAARTAATAFGGALWPNSAESFELVPHPSMTFSADLDYLLQSAEVRDYYIEATRRARIPYDAPESNFLVSWGEHLDDQMVFGTSGIFGEENESDDINPIRFHTISIETAVISEGANRMIDTVGLEKALTVRQAVDEYGLENLSEHTQKCYTNGKDAEEYIKIVHLVEPRGAVPYGSDRAEKQFKPIASIHFEVAQEHVIKNDGMDVQSAFVSRFRKRPPELYGRSLASDALPTIMELNILRRGNTKAIQIANEPPVGFYQEQLGGAGSVNLSPGAQQALYSTGSIPQSRPPVELLLPAPDTRSSNERLDKLEEKVLRKFLIDRLLDFNNKTRMTLGEAEMRTDFRNQALGNMFARQMVEILAPLIRWSVGVQFRRKMLGLHPQMDAIEIMLRQRAGQRPLVMPQVVADAVDKGLMPFAVRFISPAARAMQADELLGLEKLTNYVIALGQVDPNAIDCLETDASIEIYGDRVGAPRQAIRPKDKRKAARESRMEQLAQQAQLQVQEQSSQIAKNTAKAAKDFAQAGVNPQQGAMSA